MVRLITHNLLACHAKGCTTHNFPLDISEATLRYTTPPHPDPDPEYEFIRNFLPKLEWNALIQASRQLGVTTLPADRPEMIDDDLLKSLHHVLLEIHIEEGVMACPNCHHRYPISSGIPNMLLAEHEIG